MLAAAGALAEERVILRKCCGVNEVLDASATACARAPWPPFAPFFYHSRPLSLPGPPSAAWLRLWLPPGLPPAAVARVDVAQLRVPLLFDLYNVPVPVRSSALAAAGGEWRPDRALFRGGEAVRRGPGGGARDAVYCVDAALPPFPAPFALVLRAFCASAVDCVRHCCFEGSVLRARGDGSWECVRNASLAVAVVAGLRRELDPELRLHYGMNALQCVEGRRGARRFAPGALAPARAQLRMTADGFLSTRTSCAGGEALPDGSLQYVVVQCDVQRRARAFYWGTRPLSFVSALLLVAALASVAAAPRQRCSLHGWALACHAACLLGFNILQIAFYLSVSDRVDSTYLLDDNLTRLCLGFALSIYFLLSAANCWLTAVCWNLSTGFSATRAARPAGRRRRFLMLSAIAWGVPAALTAACASAHFTYEEHPLHAPPWYLPSFLETRTCFKEANIPTKYIGSVMVRSRKWGSALFYYIPMAVLSVANAAFIVRAALRVRYLSRGNSVLYRSGGANADGCKGQETRANQQRTNKAKEEKMASPSGSKSAAVYAKLVLMAGLLEMATEAATWGSSSFIGSQFEIVVKGMSFLDQSLSYRAVGYLTDLARAVIVLWLASPEAAHLRGRRRRPPPRRDSRRTRRCAREGDCQGSA